MSETLYRGMDRAEIDRQLNLRARWPEYEAFFARWAEESARVRGRVGGHLDLAYGDTPSQTLDLFLPEATGGAVPLLAFIHGGYWQSLDKGDFSYLAPPFLDQGIAFASLNYTLAPQASVAEMAGEMRRAFLWLAQGAGDYGVDPGRIFVAGHSAGGQLAAMTAATDWQALGPDAPAFDPVKGACSVSGVYDLEPLRLSYHQDVLGLDPDEAVAMSPLRVIPKRAGPLICAVGSEETDEFLYQQDAFVAAWRAAGLEARVVELPGRHHFSAVDALGEPDHPLFQAVRDLVLGENRS
jgi:arylformamidase